jgi:cystathionine beta-lyase/cystathionine gamma-synthase
VTADEPADRGGPGPRKFRPVPSWAGPGTKAVHGGTLRDLNAGSIVPPIYQTSTFQFPAEYSDARAAGTVHLYSRNDNPTVDGPAEVLRELEGAEEVRLFASGMGAIASTVLSLARPGDELVALSDLYGGTTELLAAFLRPYGVAIREVPDGEARRPEALLSPATRLVLLETPTNPCLRVHDVERWARAADAVGALLLVDNTFATPLNQTPLSLGADLVLHSATKYLGGHSDLLAGAVAGPRRLLRRIDPKQVLGAPLDPFAAFLLHRSLRTLPLRVARQNENGREVAAALARHPAVTRVHYPGSASPEEETIAARQMRGRGGVVALSLRGGGEAVGRFLRSLSIVQVASSLGGVESLASVPVDTSHRHLSPSGLAARGIDAGLVRLSLGVEETGDLVRDLRAALDAAAEPVPQAL